MKAEARASARREGDRRLGGGRLLAAMKAEARASARLINDYVEDTVTKFLPQ